MITVFVNNKSIAVKENIRLQEAIQSKLDHPNTIGIAVALNEKVIPNSEWNNTTLKENDKILIIKATQGG
jgi:sulfur carrier protein